MLYNKRKVNLVWPDRGMFMQQEIGIHERVAEYEDMFS